MTVVAGFLSTKGIVLASDSLESTATGYGKGMVKKVFIEPLDPSPGWLYFAGAGLPGPSEWVRHEILEALRAEGQWNLKKYVAAIRKVVRQYYQESVWPSGRETSQFAAVMALWGPLNERILLKTDQDVTVSKCESYGCVGIGAKAAERVANLMLQTSRAGCVVASFDQLVAIAAYAIWIAKETIDGCGGPTQFAAYEKDRGGPFPRVATTIDVLEKAFTEIERAEGRMLARLINHKADVNKILHDFDFSIRKTHTLTAWRAMLDEMDRHRDEFEKPSK